MYTALRLCVARVQRRATALITSIAIAQIQRAFTMLEWDEAKHPRGPGGKFIGGSGLQSERDALHLEAAHARYAKATSFAYHHRADETFHSRDAIMAMHRIMQTRAQAGAAETANDPIEAHRLAYLRAQYAQLLEQPDLTKETRARYNRETLVIDRYMQRLGQTGNASKLSDAEKKAIDTQIHQTMERERSHGTAASGTPNPIQSGTTAIPPYDITKTVTLYGVDHLTATGAGGHTGYNEATFEAFWRRISSNPRSAIDARIVLAPQTELPRKGKLAEQARRDSSPIYKTLMEKGEVSWDGKDGRMYLFRRRYNLLTQNVNYDLFVDGKTEPSPYSSLQWQNQQAYDLIQSFR